MMAGSGIKWIWQPPFRPFEGFRYAAIAPIGLIV